MEFIEAAAFTKDVYDYLSEDEYLGLQSYLIQSPESARAKWKTFPPTFFVKLHRRLKVAKRDIGQEILEDIRDVKAYKAGKKTLCVHTLRAPAAPKAIRQKLRLSQSAFAGLMGVSLRTIQDWEQGRRKPSGPAIALLNRSPKCSWSYPSLCLEFDDHPPVQLFALPGMQK